MIGRDRTMLLAVLLVSASMLAFESLLPRIFAVYIGPNFVYFSISIALVGLSSGGIVASIWEPRFFSRPIQSLIAVALLLSATTVVAVWGISVVGDWLNGAIDRSYASVLAARPTGPAYDYVLSRISAAPSMVFVLLTGLIASVPFLCGGLFVALAFRFSANPIGTLYTFDLTGAALGCVVTVLALRFLPIASTFLLVALMSAAAAVLLVIRAREPRQTALAFAAWALVVAVGGLLAASQAGQPPFDFRIHKYAHLRSLYDGPLTELRHQWTPLGRIALLYREWSPPMNATPRRRLKHFVAMDLGGHSVVESFSPENLAAIKHTSVFSDDVPEPIVVPGRYLNLHDYLVLMAGNGQDMLRAYAWYGDRINLQGVELNPVVFRLGLDFAAANLDRFFGRPQVAMALEEGRSFVERSSKRFDLILLSYSGATFATGTGSVASTPQFLFTREAFLLYLRKLNPGGVVVDAGGAGADELPHALKTFGAALRAFNPAADVRRHVVCYGRTGIDATDQFTIYHRDPPSRDQVDRLARALAPEGLTVTYSAFTPPAYPAVAAFLRDPQPDVAESVTAFRRWARDRVHTDDRPFFYFNFIWGSPGGFLVLGYLATLASALLIASLFLFVPLALDRRAGPGLSRRREATGFALLGAGFMLLEVGSIQKFELFLGHPTLTLVAVLAVLLVCSALGSLRSTALFDRGTLSVRRASFLVVACGIGVLVFQNRFIYPLMGLPLATKIAVIGAVLFPLGFLLGTLFPQLLRRLEADGRRLVPWAMATNAIFSVLSANLGALIYLFAGATAVFVCGLIAYAALGFIDPSTRQESIAWARRSQSPADTELLEGATST